MYTYFVVPVLIGEVFVGYIPIDHTLYRNDPTQDHSLI